MSATTKEKWYKMIKIETYDYDGFTVDLFQDEDGDWLAHLVELPNISAFFDNPKNALDELKIVWEEVKESYRKRRN